MTRVLVQTSPAVQVKFSQTQKVWTGSELNPPELGLAFHGFPYGLIFLNLEPRH